MKDYKKDFNDKLEDDSFCDGELISIANGYITEMQDIITELKKARQYFSDSLDKQIEATLKLHKDYQELEKENAELKEMYHESDEDNNKLRENIPILAEAKEIIRALYIAIRDGDEGVYNSCKDSFIKAEAFINKE